MDKANERMFKVETTSEDLMNEFSEDIPDNWDKNDDKCFTNQTIMVAKALLELAPQQTVRETRRIAKSIQNYSLKNIYERVFDITRATNKEISHFLSVISKYPHPNIDLQKLSDFKFISQDKYLNQVIYHYFNIVSKYQDRLTASQKLSIFYRYIYLFSNQITIDYSIYKYFLDFIHKDEYLIELLISKKLYLNLYFIKNIIIDLADELNNKIYKIGYDLPIYRKLIYSLKSNSHCSNWVAQNWNVDVLLSIPELFYRFDLTYFMKNIALKKFTSIIEPLELIRNELGSDSDIKYCKNCELRCNFNFYNGLKESIKLSIEKFNQNLNIEKPLTIQNIRLFQEVDLKRLGEFLGKEKNLFILDSFLETFNLTGLDIYEALRCFLGSFILPGESQIIERVISAFSKYYCKLNGIDDSVGDEVVQIYKNIAYGFIALNTMLHNPSYDKKITFNDYMNFLGHSEEFIKLNLPCSPLDKDALKLHFENLKENKIEAAVWCDGFDNLELFSTILDDFLLILEENQKKYCNSISVEYVSNISNIVCHNCKIFSFRKLFSTTRNNFIYLEPLTFFNICKTLGDAESYEFYISKTKRDNLTEAYKLYFEGFLPRIEVFKRFVSYMTDLFDKSKTGVFKAIFSKNNEDLKNTAISRFSQMRFESLDIFLSVSKLFSLFLKYNMPNSKIYGNIEPSENLTLKCHHDIFDILKDIILNNFVYYQNFVSDFTGFEYSILMKIFYLSPEENKFLTKYCNNIKISYLKNEFNEGRVTEENVDLFKQLNTYNQDSFDCYCYLQKLKYKMEPGFKIIKVENSMDDPKFGRDIRLEGYKHVFYSFEDTFKECMKDSTNLMKFFTTSQSMLNLNFCKLIHKDDCPLNISEFNDFDSIIYLLLKCESNNNAVFTYLSYILNYLSDSLILYVNLLSTNYSIFYQIDKEIIEVIVKILLKRIRVYKKGGVVCCQKSNFNFDNSIRRLIEQLLRDNFVDSENLNGFSDLQKQDPMEL